MLIPATRIYIYPNEEQADRIDYFLYKTREFEILLQNDIKAMQDAYAETRTAPVLKTLSEYKEQFPWIADIDSNATRSQYSWYAFHRADQVYSYVRKHFKGEIAGLFQYIPTQEETLRYMYYFTRSESIKFKCDKGLFIPLLGFVEMDGDEQDEEEIHTRLYVHREDKGEGDGFEYFVTLKKLDYVYPGKEAEQEIDEDPL